MQVQVSSHSLAELEMIVREATEVKCQFLEKKLLLTIERARGAEKEVLDLKEDIARLSHINGVEEIPNAD